MDINSTMRELAEYIRLAEEAAANIEALKDAIKAYMSERDIDTVTGQEHKATYKAVTSARIDTAALKQAAPDIAAQYTKTTTSERFLFV